MVPETADCQRTESVLGCKCRRSLAHRRKISSMASPSMSQRQGELLRQQQEKVPWGKALRIQQSQLSLTPWPMKATVAQPLVQQKISVSRPVERLNPIRPAAAKQKQALFIQPTPILLRDNGCQSVDPAAQIGIPAGDIVAAHMTEVYHTV